MLVLRVGDDLVLWHDVKEEVVDLSVNNRCSDVVALESLSVRFCRIVVRFASHFHNEHLARLRKEDGRLC